eukprot:gene45171-61197_t
MRFVVPFAVRVDVASLFSPSIERLSAISENDTFDAGEILVREGDPATNLFNITAGAVRVYKLLPDGRRQIVGFLFAGDFLGLATGDRYAFSAEALSAGAAVTELAAKTIGCVLKAGDIVRMETPGGGGHGDPRAASP